MTMMIMILEGTWYGNTVANYIHPNNYYLVIFSVYSNDNFLQVVHNPVPLEANSIRQLCADAVCDLFGGPNQLSGDALVVLRKTLSSDLNATLSLIAQSYSMGAGCILAPVAASDGGTALMTAASSTPIRIEDVLLKR